MGRSQQFKFIRFSKKRPDGRPFMVLFDMNNDPHETKNLADDPKFASMVNRESAAMDTFLLQFGVPPVNLQLKVSAHTLATSSASGYLEVVHGREHIAFIAGKNMTGRSSIVDLSIYSRSGALIRHVNFDSQKDGGYSWNLRSDAGQTVKSNLYLYRCTFKNNQGRQVSACGKLIRVER
jgi:hypothetical protein